MLQIMRRGQRWIMWFVIVVVGGAFVFFLGSGGGGPGGAAPQYVAVDVDGRRYDMRDVDRVRQRQVAEYRRTLGDAFDPETAADFLDEMAARVLVRRAILAREAERMGLRVTDGEVRAYLRSIPGTEDDEGRIDQDIVRRYAEREYGTLSRFEASLRDDLLSQKASRLVRESVAVSDAEVRQILRHRQEEVEIAYVTFDPSALAAEKEISDAEVDAFLTENAERLRTIYDQRLGEFDKPEQIRARHILIRIPQGDDAEQAEALAKIQAEEALARIRGGEDFAKVAEELSVDPGSKTQGGDLGFFPRGRMVKPFEDAAFALAPGELSEPVKTVHGWHVIRTEELRPAQRVSFEEAQPGLARELIEEESGDAVAREKAGKLVAAIGEGKSLIDAARERDLVIERPEPLRRRDDGVIPGLGVSREALTAIFGLSEETPTSTELFEVSGKLVLFERTGGSQLNEEELAAQVPTTRQQLLADRRNRYEQAWVDARRTELTKRGNLIWNLDAARGS
jgi:peptidyl-prolyl cis-trans isomerase D